MLFHDKPDMSIYDMTVRELPAEVRDRVSVVADGAELNRKIAAEFADALAEKQARGEMLTIICPVGQVDYACFVQAARSRGLSCPRRGARP